MVVTQIRQLAARGVSVVPPRYDLKHEAGGEILTFTVLC